MALSNAERQKAYRERKKAEKELDRQAPKEVQEELCNELMRQVPPSCVVEGHPDDLSPVKIEPETITYFDVYKRRHEGMFK